MNTVARAWRFRGQGLSNIISDAFPNLGGENETKSSPQKLEIKINYDLSFIYKYSCKSVLFHPRVPRLTGLSEDDSCLQSKRGRQCS
jgi:hypothetical protein